MDAAQAASFREQGWVHVRGAIPPPLLARLNAVLDTHIERWRSGLPNYDGGANGVGSALASSDERLPGADGNRWVSDVRPAARRRLGRRRDRPRRLPRAAHSTIGPPSTSRDPGGREVGARAAVDPAGAPLGVAPRPRLYRVREAHHPMHPPCPTQPHIRVCTEGSASPGARATTHSTAHPAGATRWADGVPRHVRLGALVRRQGRRRLRASRIPPPEPEPSPS